MRDWSTMSPAIDGSSLVAHAISFLNRPSLLDDVSREQMPSAGLESQSNALPPSPPSSGDLTMGAQTALVDWEMSSSTPGSEFNPFVLPATPSVTSQASTRMPTPMLISDLLEWDSLSSTFDADFNLSAPSNAHTSFMPPDDTIGANIGGPVDSVETQPSKSMDMYGALSQGPYPVAVTDDFWSTKSYAELYMAIKEEDQWKKTAFEMHGSMDVKPDMALGQGCFPYSGYFDACTCGQEPCSKVSPWTPLHDPNISLVNAAYPDHSFDFSPSFNAPTMPALSRHDGSMVAHMGFAPSISAPREGGLGAILGGLPTAALYTTVPIPRRTVKSKPKSKPSMRVKCTELGCTKTFSSIHNMNEHRRTHVLPRERAYVCPECHSDYIHRRDQHRHMRHKHGYPPKSRARKQASPKPKDN